MATIDLFGTTFTVRDDQSSDTIAPYSPAGVKQKATGIVRLSLSNTTPTKSAGIYGPVIAQNTTYEIQFRCRVDQMDPAVVFAVWGQNAANGDEVDFIEATRWGDNHNDDLYHMGEFAAGVRVGALTSEVGRAHHKYKLVFSGSALAGFTSQLFGWWNSNNGWKEVASDSMTWYSNLTLKMAVWIPTTGFVYAGAGDRGPTYVDIEGFSVS